MRKQIWLLIAALIVAIVAVFWFVYWQPQQTVVNQVSDESAIPAPVSPSEVIQDEMPTTNPFEVPVNPYEAYVNPFGQDN